MAKKKRVEKVGTIYAMDLIKTSRPMQDIPFRTGGHTTQKDRPRKRISKRDIDKYM